MLKLVVEGTDAAIPLAPFLNFATFRHAAGFRIERFDSHGYAQTAAPDYMLTLVDRGADLLATAGRIDRPLADALKREAQRRVEDGVFFGFIAFASVIARKPG